MLWVLISIVCIRTVYEIIDNTVIIGYNIGYKRVKLYRT